MNKQQWLDISAELRREAARLELTHEAREEYNRQLKLQAKLVEMQCRPESPATADDLRRNAQKLAELVLLPPNTTDL